MTEAIPEDEGEYTIKAVNDKGIATCSAEVLIKMDKPTFTRPLSDATVNVGQTALLECEVIGSPRPLVRWLANQTFIEDSEKYHTRYDGNLAVLEIQDVTLEDEGVVFTCKAENFAGESTTTAQLHAQGTVTKTTK